MRAVLGGTVNDVALSIIVEGAARYLREHGVRTAGQQLRIMCPVNVRREEDTGFGNRVSAMFPTLPAWPMGALARLESTRTIMERLKTDRVAQALELLIETSPPVPPTLMAPAILMAGAPSALTADLQGGLPGLPPLAHFGYNFVVTNVPGVQVPLYIAGTRIEDQTGLMMMGGNVGYAVCIQTYNQKLYFSMTAEPALMPDIDQMKAAVGEVYDEMKQAADRRS
jgi:hypothetical protein